jgi:hypothetical protein
MICTGLGAVYAKFVNRLLAIIWRKTFAWGQPRHLNRQSASNIRISTPLQLIEGLCGKLLAQALQPPLQTEVF